MQLLVLFIKLTYVSDLKLKCICYVFAFVHLNAMIRGLADITIKHISCQSWLLHDCEIYELYHVISTRLLLNLYILALLLNFVF